MDTKSPLGQRKKIKATYGRKHIVGTNFDQQRQLSREQPVSPGGSDGEDFVCPLIKATWRENPSRKSHVLEYEKDNYSYNFCGLQVLRRRARDGTGKETPSMDGRMDGQHVQATPCIRANQPTCLSSKPIAVGSRIWNNIHAIYGDYPIKIWFGCMCIHLNPHALK
jgi:hypothetical protein